MERCNGSHGKFACFIQALDARDRQLLGLGAASGAYATKVGCDARSPNPAFRTRLQYTSQNNSNYLNIRQPIKPLADLSMFKKLIVREGTSFEIRGEFFNILNTPNWGGPSTSLGASNTGSAGGGGSAATPNGIANQANDARIGQLTARINF